MISNIDSLFKFSPGPPFQVKIPFCVIIHNECLTEEICKNKMGIQIIIFNSYSFINKVIRLKSYII